MTRRERKDLPWIITAFALVAVETLNHVQHSQRSTFFGLIICSVLVKPADPIQHFPASREKPGAGGRASGPAYCLSEVIRSLRGISSTRSVQPSRKGR
jgi:hypothetical protein